MTPVTQSIRRNIGASWFAHAVGLVIGFFLMPYVIHVLGDSQYGVWVFINCIASYSGLLYLGFGLTISRYVAKYSSEGDWDRLNQVVTLVFFVFLGMGLFAFSIAAVLAILVPYLPLWKDYSTLEIQSVILMLGLNVATGLVGSVFGGVLMGLRRFDLERGVSFCCDLTRLLLIVLFLRRDWGLLTIATIYWGVTLTENLGYLILAYWQLPKLTIRFRLLNRQVYQECCEFSGFAFLNAIAQQLIYATDTLVIGVMLGEKAITPFFIGQRLCQYLRQPIEKVSDICMPTAGAMQSEAQRQSLPKLLHKAFGLTFLLSAGIFIGAWYFSPAVIQVWMGPGYEETPHVIMILLLGQLIALPTGVVRAIMFGTGNVRTPALVYLLEATANLLLSMILVMFIGIQGVAWGTTIPIVVFELGIILPYGLKQVNMSLKNVWRESIVPQAIPLLSLWAYSAVISARFPQHHSWPAIFSITLGGGAVLLVSWFAAHVLARRTADQPLASTS